jgi:hypothetical protein
MRFACGQHLLSSQRITPGPPSLTTVNLLLALSIALEVLDVPLQPLDALRSKLVQAGALWGVEHGVSASRAMCPSFAPIGRSRVMPRAAFLVGTGVIILTCQLLYPLSTTVQHLLHGLADFLLSVVLTPEK